MMWHFLSCASFKITISCKLPHQKRGKNCRFCLAILKHAKLSCQIIGHHGYRGWVTHTASSKNVETLLRKKRHFLLQIAASHWGLWRAVCVTTPKGSWVKLFMSLISIVTRSNSHLVREMNQNPGSKHCFLFWAIWRIFKTSYWP